MATFVLIHAFGSSHRAWQRQVETLSGEHRVLTPDLPGHGDTPGPLTLDGATTAVRKLIAAESEPVHVVGISGGATVAMLTALAEGERVAGLVVSGGVARAASGDALQRTLMSLLPAGMLVNMMKGMYSGGDQDYLPTAVEDLRRAGKATLLAGVREIGALDLRPRLAELRTPTLVLCGESDKANIAPAKEIAAGIEDAELRLVPKAGHLWNLELPDLFSRTLADFAGRG